jgi:pimeloyl-ACP methyl ester carboxylesterase
MKRFNLARLTTLVFCLAMSPFSAAQAGDYERSILKVSTDLTLYYETAGKGEIPIVFVPGWTMSSAVFERQREHFANSDRFRYYAYDPRGQGQSSKPMDGYTYDQHGRDLKAFLDGLGLKQVVLVGWSFGVLKVTSYLEQFGSDNLRALVLIDGTPKTTGKDSTRDWAWVGDDNWLSNNQAYSTELLTNKREENMKEFSQWMLEHPTPEQVRWSTDISLQTPGWIAALTNATANNADYEDALKAFDSKLPLLFVMGTEHWQPVVEQWVKANRPSTQLVTMGRHLMFWQRSEEFNTELDKFLKSFM